MKSALYSAARKLQGGLKSYTKGWDLFFKYKNSHICDIMSPLVVRLFKFMVAHITLVLAKSHCQGFPRLANVLSISVKTGDAYLQHGPRQDS